MEYKKGNGVKSERDGEKRIRGGFAGFGLNTGAEAGKM